MDKTKLAIGGGALAALCLLFGLFQLVGMQQENQAQKQAATYQESHTYHYALNETVSLDSEQDKDGENYAWNAGFDWNGTMELTLKSVSAFNSADDAPLDATFTLPDIADYRSFITDSEGSPCFLLLELSIDNVDAAPKSDQGDSDFNISLLNPHGDYVFSELCYFDGNYCGTKQETSTNYYHYFLEPGESKTFHLGFYADETMLDEGFALVAGITGLEKYVIDITPGDIERNGI